jgi:superfamily II DNA or RNA helicase
MAFALRDYQQDLVDRCLNSLSRGGSPIIVAPTGSGKSAILADITTRLLATSDETVILLCHRREILTHLASSVAKHCGIEPGLICSDSNQRIDEITSRVVVAMAPTFVRRIHQIPESWANGSVNLLLDEGHHATAPTWGKLIAALNPKFLAGATATPVSCNQAPLGSVYSEILLGPEPAELVTRGFLAPVKVIAAEVGASIDTTGIKTRGGDYVLSDLEKRAKKIIGNTVELWLHHGQGLQTLVACCGLEHSRDTADAFNHQGITAQAIDGSMAIAERDQILEDYKSGAIKVLTFVSMIDEGLDIPEASCLVFSRPTKSIRLRRQLEGRVRRIMPGKSHAIVIDQTSGWSDLPLPDDQIQWNLAMGGEAGAAGRKIDPEKEELVRAPDGTVSIQELSPEQFAEIQREKEAKVWDSQPEIIKAMRTSRAAAVALFRKLRLNKFKRMSQLNSLQSWDGLTLELLEEVGSELGFSSGWAPRTYSKAVFRQSNLVSRKAQNDLLKSKFRSALKDAVETGELGKAAQSIVCFSGTIGSRIVAEVDGADRWTPEVRRSMRVKLVAALAPRLEPLVLEVPGLETPPSDEERFFEILDCRAQTQESRRQAQLVG